MVKAPGGSTPGYSGTRWLWAHQVAVGAGLRPPSSSQLFTFEGLIGKEMSPGCENVTKAGAEVTSSREERASGG